MNTPTGPLMPAGCGQQGRYDTRPLPDACAEEGGIPADPVPTMQSEPLLGLLLIASGWPLVIVVVGAIVALVNYLPLIGG